MNSIPKPGIAKASFVFSFLVLLMTGLIGVANAAPPIQSANVSASFFSPSLSYLTLLQIVPNVQSSNNVISNPSVETTNPANKNQPLDWSTDHWGTNNAIFTYLKNYGHTGTSSVKVQINSYTDGDAKWDFTPIPVKPGDTYNFSDWYQSNVVSQVVIDFTNTDGTDYYVGLRNAPPSSNWIQYSESFQVPYKAKSMTVYHLIASTGSLTTDDYSLVKFTPKGFKRPIVSLTFDNCWEDNTDTVMPILKSYGYTGTVYISTNYTIKSPSTGPADVSGVNAIKTFFAARYEIASHSVYHEIDLSNDTPSDLVWELTQSKAYLANLVGAANVMDFATPFGAYNDNVINAIKPLYLSHRTTDVGYNNWENFDPYRLTVQNLQNNTTLAEYQSWINQAVKDKSWLILVYHCVAPGPISTLSEWDTPLKDFQPQMNAIKNSGITVETVAQALNETTLQFSNHTTTSTTSTTSTTTSTSSTTSKSTTTTSTSISSSTSTSESTSTSSTSSITSSTSSSTSTIPTTTIPETTTSTIPTTSTPTSTTVPTTSTTTESTSTSTIPTTTIPETTTSTIPTTSTSTSTTVPTTSTSTISSTTTTSTTTIPASCSGTPLLVLSPNPAGASSNVNAIVSGLSNCNGLTITIKDYQGCTSGATIATFIGTATGGSVIFKSPNANGQYGYYTCINSGGSTKTILTVS